ncbi:MAG: hypothetical protein ACSHX8_05915 [Opitutaceae bacterium]
MAETTNLTDRIAHLRERRGDSTIIQGGPPNNPKQAPGKATGERKFATDTFMMLVYGLLIVSLIAQVVLIVWLDIA